MRYQNMMMMMMVVVVDYHHMTPGNFPQQADQCDRVLKGMDDSLGEIKPYMYALNFPACRPMENSYAVRRRRKKEDRTRSTSGGGGG